MHATDMREQMWLQHSGLDVHDPDYQAKAKAYIAEKYGEMYDPEAEPEPILNRHQRRAIVRPRGGKRRRQRFVKGVKG